jgi:hypothetical protein
MIAYFNLDERLSILRIGDTLWNWDSLDDQRVCGLCGRKFKGRQVEIRRLPGGKLKLFCPTLGCLSTPHQWRCVNRPFAADPAGTRWRNNRRNKTQQRASESTLKMQACRV